MTPYFKYVTGVWKGRKACGRLDVKLRGQPMQLADRELLRLRAPRG